MARAAKAQSDKGPNLVPPGLSEDRGAWLPRHWRKALTEALDRKGDAFSDVIGKLGNDPLFSTGGWNGLSAGPLGTSFDGIDLSAAAERYYYTYCVGDDYAIVKNTEGTAGYYIIRHRKRGEIIDLEQRKKEAAIVVVPAQYGDNKETGRISGRSYNPDNMEEAARKIFKPAADYLGLPVEVLWKSGVEAAREKAARETATARAKAKPRAKKSASPKLTAIRLAAAFETLKQSSDLDNPKLSATERRQRANHLVKTYERLHKRDPGFRDDSGVVGRARSIVNDANYQRRKKAKQAAKAATMG
jgi:hypothetical protein